MTKTTDQVIEKIRKLLALSESDNPNESANALAKAMALMDEHRLEMAQIQETSGAAVEMISIDATEIPIGRARTQWRAWLASSIGRENGCAHMVRSYFRRGHYERFYVFVGRPSDVAIARYLYVFCEAEVQRLTKRLCAGRGAHYAMTFREACAATIGNRIKSDHDASPAVGLMVRSAADKAKDFLHAQEGLGKARQLNGAAKWDAEAKQAGIKAGKSVEINKALASPAPPARPALGAGE